MKKTASVLIGIVLIILGTVSFLLLKNTSKKENIETQSSIKVLKVETETVSLQSLPYTIESTGTLTAKNKIELYSEVQGVLRVTNTPFKIGNTFYKGQTLLRIDSDEYHAQLQSNKSTLINQIAAMLPDMKIEYPEAAKIWEQYLKDFNINGSLPSLPETSSSAEKFFVTGKNVIQTYYTVKNLQERLAKYYIKAPFTGIVTESNVNVGTLVRSGQKLGEFINPTIYELSLSIPVTDNKYIKKGKEVKLITMNNSNEYQGKISRINSKINQATQTIEIILEVTDKNLKDGQYLKAQILGDSIKDAYLIRSELLIENDKVYVINNNTLQLQKVTPINYLQDKVMIHGLQNGQILVSAPVTNGYPGMQVNIKNE